MTSLPRILRMGLILGGIWMLALSDAAATHIVGGDLTYRCLGNNQYEIRLTLRRDCLLAGPGTEFDDPASIGFFDAVTNQRVFFVGFGGELEMPYNEDDTLNQILISDCTIAGNDVCVHQTTYVDTIFLPFYANGYIMSYQRCCRNASLNNVVDPLNTGMTMVAELSALAQNTCNSSPQFGPYPPIYICVNQPISFDHHAIDAAGDSLVYALETPFAGGDMVNNKPQPPPLPPYPLVNWRPPYNLLNLMGGVPLQINSSTGLITGTPNTIGQFVIGITVTAYRNGVVTGKTRRDFQYNVRMCRDVPMSAFTAPDLTCDGLTVSFTNQSTLADEYTWIFDFGNPGSATSNAENPTYTYPQDGFYNVALIVNDGDSICFDTFYQQVGVFQSQLDAAFDLLVGECTDGITLNVTDQSASPPYNVVSWEWLLTYPGGIIPSSDQHPTFEFDIEDSATVFLVLIATDENGCTDTQAQSFQVKEFSIAVDPDSEHLCAGDSTQLILNGDPTLDYTWDPTGGLDLTEEWDPIAYPGISIIYNVTVTDGLCTQTATIPVEVQQLPNLSFDYTTDCKSLLVEFQNGSSNGDLYHWDFGDPNVIDDTSEDENPSYTYDTPGTYIVTLSSRDGCDVEDTLKITVNAILETLEPTTTNCFMDSIALNPVIMGDYMYSWSPAEFLNDPNSPNPNAGVEDDMTFYVTITEASLPGCVIVDSIRVIIPDLFKVEVPEDTTDCSRGPVELLATIEGNVEDYEWTVNGNPVSEELLLVVNPIATTTYVFTATDSLGCEMSDAVTLTRPDSNFLLIASNDTAYCNQQSITLFASSSDGVTFQWVNPMGDTIGDQPTVLVSPNSTATYEVIGTDPNGCQEKEIVTLTPTFFDLDITDTQNICLGDEVTIAVVDMNGQELTYLWSPDGQNTSSITVSPNDTTTYAVEVTNTEVGCKDTLYSTVVVSLFDPVDVIITATMDSIILTQNTQLFVNQDPDFDYVWSSVPPENIDNVYNPVVMPGETATYTVTVTNEAGCTGVASYSITVINPFCDERDIFLPNAFTPNDDGVNDIWFVRSNFVTSMELYVYNRWGQEVFYSNSLSNGWDGRFKGERVVPDVFGYYLRADCPNGETHIKKGNVTILE